MKYLVATAIFAGLLVSGAARAETVWAPPAEIADKVKAEGAAGAAPAAETKGSAATDVKAAATPADKEKDCKAQADAKGLHGKARKKFHADCLKG